MMMTADDGVLVDSARAAVTLFAGTATLMLAPVMIAAVVVGVIQTAMSISEQTLSFLPKLAILALVLIIAGGTVMRQLGDFATGTLGDIVVALHGP